MINYILKIMLSPQSTIAVYACCCCLIGAAHGLTLDLSNWMGQLSPILGDASILDLSVPGTHDSVTFDLSTDLSDGFEGLPPLVSDILHALTPVIAGGFIREQGQTQGLNMTEQLDSGMRFIDFRIMYSDPPAPVMYVSGADTALAKAAGVAAGATKDWYGLHGCQTQRTSLSFLEAAKAWLVAHPKEVVVFWSSRHGDNSLNGTTQYPDTTPAQRQAFWKQIVTTFDGLLFDASTSPLNETSIATMLSRGQRVVWFAADWADFTGSDARAMPNEMIENQLPSSGDETGALGVFRTGAATRASQKARNRFFLASLADSGPTCQVEYAALIKFLPIDVTADCKSMAKCFNIPGVDDWCPLTLMEYGLFNNYYNQRMIEQAWIEGATNAAVDFPNAIYIDVVDHGGAIRVGTQRINPLERKVLDGYGGGTGSIGHNTTGYAYAATVIGQNVRRLCRGKPATQRCGEDLLAAIETARAALPLTLWNDTSFGRLDTNWPVLPPAAVEHFR